MANPESLVALSLWTLTNFVTYNRTKWVVQQQINLVWPLVWALRLQVTRHIPKQSNMYWSDIPNSIRRLLWSVATLWPDVFLSGQVSHIVYNYCVPRAVHKRMCSILCLTVRLVCCMAFIAKFVSLAMNLKKKRKKKQGKQKSIPDKSWVGAWEQSFLPW